MSAQGPQLMALTEDVCLGPLTQEFIQKVENILPGCTCLLPSHLSKVGGTIVQVHPINAFGQEAQHPLKRPQSMNLVTEQKDATVFILHCKFSSLLSPPL